MDRLKDMIVTGGENVYSIEVENAIADHPAVLEVAVIGIPDATWGEQVHAIVVTRPGAKATRRGDQRARPPDDRPLQGAEVDRVPDRAASLLGRHEAAEARAPPPLLGGNGDGRRSGGRSTHRHLKTVVPAKSSRSKP